MGGFCCVTLTEAEKLIEGANKSKGLLSKVCNILLELFCEVDQYKAKWEQDLGFTSTSTKGKTVFRSIQTDLSV